MAATRVGWCPWRSIQAAIAIWALGCWSSGGGPPVGGLPGWRGGSITGQLFGLGRAVVGSGGGPIVFVDVVVLVVGGVGLGSGFAVPPIAGHGGFQDVIDGDDADEVVGVIDDGRLSRL